MIDSTQTSGFFLLTADSALETQTEEKIRSFGELPQGWNYGEGGPMSEEQIEVALLLLRYAAQLGWSRTNAFPGVSDEIMLTLYKGHKYYIEITINSGSDIDLVFEKDRREEMDYEGLSVERLKRKLRLIAREVWPTSASSIGDTMIMIEASSKTLPSSGRHWIMGFQSSSGDALTGVAGRYVNIFVNSTTSQSPKIHQSIGNLKKGSYRRIVA
jgi:hypothetical protein